MNLKTSPTFGHLSSLKNTTSLITQHGQLSAYGESGERPNYADLPAVEFQGIYGIVKDNGVPAISLGGSMLCKYVDTQHIPAGMPTQQRNYFVQYVGNVSVKLTLAVLRVI